MGSSLCVAQPLNNQTQQKQKHLFFLIISTLLLLRRTGCLVLELEVLVGELLAVDGLAASTITSGEVTTLDHEVLDDTVEATRRADETLVGIRRCKTLQTVNSSPLCTTQQVMTDIKERRIR